MCMHVRTTIRWASIALTTALWLAREFGFVCSGWLFYFFFDLWYVVLGQFSLPQIAFDFTSTPALPDSSRRRSSMPLPTAPRNHVEHLFRKVRQFWTLIKLLSPRDYFETRRRYQQQDKSFSSPNRQWVPSTQPHQISFHFAAGAVDVGRGAVSFLATQSTGTVLIPRLLTRIEGHVWKRITSALDHHFET